MRRDDDLPEYSLDPAEAEELRTLVASLQKRGGDPVSPGFYDRHWSTVEHLPAGLRRFLERFRRTESSVGCLVRGLPVDDRAIGPTPGHWEAASGADRTVNEELALALCGLTLGEPFTWATLQSGRIIQNILPIAGDEWLQNGYGSKALLEFHTEDAFHPHRCDYLLLLGLRNPDRVPTTVASVREIDLRTRDREVLARKRFHILPDDEHIRQLELRSPDHPALAEMIRMRDRPEPVAVLIGDPGRPYLRIDRPFMRCVAGDGEAERALDRLMEELERVQRDVVVGPGTLLVLDNYLCVHGRRAFRAREDGTDRWLKKATVRRDLRRGAAPGGTDSHRILI
jgi:Fe(II)/alpha-ketoglutarate-dependent arginine beta-hydroxylase